MSQGAVARAVVAHRRGGPEVLTVDAMPMPEPGPGEVRLRVEAAGVSFADTLMRAGAHPESPPVPFVPGWDVVGVVEATGPGVDAALLGERVAALTVHGGNTTHLRWPADDLVAIPADVDPASVACLVMDGVVGWQMLHRIAKVRAGQRVLVHGASGSVGNLLLQLGSLAELTMVGTASARNRDAVERYGGTFVDRHALADGRLGSNLGHFDAVFDGVGGRTTWDALSLAKPGGTVVFYGLTSTLRDGRRDMRRSLAASGIYVASRIAGMLRRRRVLLYSIQRLKRRHPTWYRDDLASLIAMLREGRIAPVIAERVAQDDVPAIHKRLAGPHPPGKYVVVMDSPGQPVVHA